MLSYLAHRFADKLLNSHSVNCFHQRALLCWSLGLLFEACHLKTGRQNHIRIGTVADNECKPQRKFVPYVFVFPLITHNTQPSSSLPRGVLVLLAHLVLNPCRSRWDNMTTGSCPLWGGSKLENFSSYFDCGLKNQ